ncbi:hypothetical protein GF325_10345, partial [Candidatus Bathyarchaeota archaeon]|nr:hypothetical protein [Candidatus Bathyarchaeota archaeon]
MRSQVKLPSLCRMAWQSRSRWTCNEHVIQVANTGDPVKLRIRLALLKTWAILFLAFAGFLVIGLFVGEYYLGLANAYPGYDLKMFFQDAVHTTRYLTWSQVFFNFDAVVSNLLHDVLIAFFLAGVYLHFMPRRDHGSPARAWRRELAVGVPVLAIIVISLLGASGLFGYQEAGVEGRLLLVQGLDD